MGKSIYILMFILLSSVALATELTDGDYIKKGESTELLFTCFSAGSPCSSASACNLTMLYPNNSILVSDYALSKVSGTNNKFNYTFSDTQTLGVYKGVYNCVDNSNSNYVEFKIKVNDSGLEENIILYLGYFIMIIGIIFAYLYAGFNVDEKKFGVKVLLFFSAFLMIVAGLLSTILIQTNYIGLYLISEIMLIGNGLLLIIMVSYYVYYMITNNTNALAEEDEVNDYD